MPEQYVVKAIGLSYAGATGEAYAVAGEVISDAPLHGTGRCSKDCALPGAHDWLLAGVLELAPEPETKKKGGK